MNVPLVANIPAEMKERRQWVAWKGVPKKGGKLDKIPMDPATGESASSTDPATWGSIQEALIAAERFRLDGIGFVFCSDDDLCGIDLDDCITETGGLEPWAARWVNLFNSYCEVSQSGRGIHIVIRGRKPDGFDHCRKGHVEVYDRDRFFVCTGRLFNGSGIDSVPAG